MSVFDGYIIQYILSIFGSAVQTNLAVSGIDKAEVHRLGVKIVEVSRSAAVFADNIAEHKLAVFKAVADLMVFVLAVTVNVKPTMFIYARVIVTRVFPEKHIPYNCKIHILIRLDVVQSTPSFQIISVSVACKHIAYRHDMYFKPANDVRRKDRAHFRSGDPVYSERQIFFIMIPVRMREERKGQAVLPRLPDENVEPV